MKRFLVCFVLGLCLLGGWVFSLSDLFRKDDSGVKIEYYTNLAEEQAALGGYGLAADCYQNIIKLQDSVEARLKLADMYMQAGFTSEYKDTLESLIAAFPQDARGYEALAGYYDSVQDHSDCVAVVRQAYSAGAGTESLRELYYQHTYSFVFLRGSYESAAPMKYGTSVVASDGVYGMLNSSGDLAHNATYTQLSPSCGELTACKNNEASGFISTDGKWYIVLKDGFDKAYSFHEGFAVVFRDGKAEYIDRSGTSRLGSFEDATGFSNGVAAVKSDGAWRLIDTSGAYLTSDQFEDIKVDAYGLCSSEEVIFVKQNGAWKLIDLEGVPCSDLTFEDAYPFFDGTMAAICIDGKWGFLKKDGTLALEPTFDGATSFGKGMAAVLKDSKWGYIDTAFRMVIEPQFSEAGPFSICGVAPVKLDGNWRFIKLSVQGDDASW